MRVEIIGAGPAGLYAAILLKRRRPDLDVRVSEQNAADATFGFGVVFSDQALDFLSADDPETAALIAPTMRRWSDIRVTHRGETIAIDGIGFAAIGRLDLLRLLQARAAALGIAPRYGQRLDALPEADLVIGADGLNSTVRASDPVGFGETITHLDNRFAWFGATRDYPALTQSFIETDAGPMNAHHYGYAPGRATFIVEMGPDTFARAGLAEMDEAASARACEGWFAPVLDGARLVTNASHWRRFPQLSCARYHLGNRVLVGDALHTAHFSIGSGTRLALEDVQALVAALETADWDIPRALPLYQARRQPVLDKITAAARASAEWYEDFGTHMDLAPWPFALSYIRRAGRLPPDRLARLAPGFTAELAARGLI